ncbi:CBS domain-containing protein [Candidatus Woesearchaeota archaeon]|nr:CBS domain-containing protein [Candidatus Woesearchaeota archaeon]
MIRAKALMVDKRVSILLVVKNNLPLSIVTEKSLIAGTLKKDLSKVKVKDVINKDFLAIEPETNYSYIIKKLMEDKIKVFPVVENNNLVGIITESDVVNATRDFTRFHQIMQEAILIIFGLVTTFFLFYFSPLGQSLIK